MLAKTHSPNWLFCFLFETKSQVLLCKRCDIYDQIVRTEVLVCRYTQIFELMNNLWQIDSICCYLSRVVQTGLSNYTFDTFLWKIYPISNVLLFTFNVNEFHFRLGNFSTSILKISFDSILLSNTIFLTISLWKTLIFIS